MKSDGKIMAAILIGSMAALAAVWAANPNPEHAKALRNQAESYYKQAAVQMSNAERYSGEHKALTIAYAEAFKAFADAIMKSAEAAEKGDDEAIKTTSAERNKAERSFILAQDRFLVRQRQAAIAPNDNQIVHLKTVTPEVNKAFIDGMLTARESALKSGDVFAEQITAEASQDDIENARDVYTQVQNELEVAYRALLLANERAKLAERIAGAGDAAISAKLTELEKTDAAILAAMKETRAQAIQMGMNERKRAAARKEIDSTISKIGK